MPRQHLVKVAFYRLSAISAQGTCPSRTTKRSWTGKESRHGYRGFEWYQKMSPGQTGIRSLPWVNGVSLGSARLLAYSQMSLRLPWVNSLIYVNPEIVFMFICPNPFYPWIFGIQNFGYTRSECHDDKIHTSKINHFIATCTMYFLCPFVLVNKPLLASFISELS